MGSAGCVHRDPAHGAEGFDDIDGNVSDGAGGQLFAEIDAGSAGIGFLNTIVEVLQVTILFL